MTGRVPDPEGEIAYATAGERDERRAAIDVEIDRHRGAGALEREHAGDAELLVVAALAHPFAQPPEAARQRVERPRTARRQEVPRRRDDGLGLPCAGRDD